MRRAVTLIELLVVIAITSILSALLLSGIQSARRSAERVECAAKMKNLGLAVHSHLDVHRYFPVQVNPHVDSWMYAILPFIEQDALWRSGQSAGNYAKTWYTPVPAFLCPSDSRQLLGENYWWDHFTYSMTSYLGVAGTDSFAQDDDGIFGRPFPIRADQVTRGLSNTLMVGERPPNSTLFWGWWAFSQRDSTLWAVGDARPSPEEDCPEKMYFGAGCLADPCHVNHFWSFHSGGGNFLLADGSVQWMEYEAGAGVVPGMAGVR